MSSATVVHHEEDHSHELSYAMRLKNNRLGLWLFFGSELFLFGALLRFERCALCGHAPIG